MKKLLLGIGTSLAAITPVIAVVACSSSDKKDDTKDKITTTGKDPVSKVTTTGKVPAGKVLKDKTTTILKDIASTQNADTDYSNGYWAKQILPHPVNRTFTWNADETHSVLDIINIMDKQLHYTFKKSLAHMTALDFANYITNLYRNNGGGEWSFKVIYKGEEDIVKINPQQILEEFVKGLDGDNNKPQGLWLNKYVSASTPRGSEFKKADGTLLPTIDVLLGKMTTAGKDTKGAFGFAAKYGVTLFTGLDMKGIMDLLVGLPGEAMFVFPQFAELFIELGKLFKKSPIARKWIADQNPATQTEFSTIETGIIRKVLLSGV